MSAEETEYFNNYHQFSQEDKDDGQRIKNKANILTSAFDDLQGPELYDPSWYNNKLRGEFGRLGSKQMSGPVLPKSYHLRSEDLDAFSNDGDDDDEEDDGDDDGDGDHSDNHHHNNTKHKKSYIQPLKSGDLPVDSMHNNGALVASPVTNEFDKTLSDQHSQNQPSSSSSNSQNIKNHNNKSNAPKKLRFSRKSGFIAASTSSSANNQQTTGDESSPSMKESQQQQPNENRRQSRIFRASRMFMGNNSIEKEANGGNKSRLRKSRNLAFAGGGKNGGGVGGGLSRKTIIFEWPSTTHDSLVNIRNIIENQYLGIVMLQKINELRMQIPFCNENRTIAFTLVISVEEIKYNRGSRITFRRSFADSLRGSSDEFDFLCAQIYEQVSQLFPSSRPVFP